MSKLVVNITMWLDGFVAAPNQGASDSFGVGGMQLHQWLVALKTSRETHGDPAGASLARRRNRRLPPPDRRRRTPKRRRLRARMTASRDHGAALGRMNVEVQRVCWW
jgi:hypothetical protein